MKKEDAVVAGKVRHAGAIMLGKGTVGEVGNFIALGMPTGFSSQLRFQLFQAPGADLAKVGYGFNPYDPRMDPRTKPPFNDGRPGLATGGSSSGPGTPAAATPPTLAVDTRPPPPIPLPPA